MKFPDYKRFNGRFMHKKFSQKDLNDSHKEAEDVLFCRKDKLYSEEKIAADPIYSLK